MPESLIIFLILVFVTVIYCNFYNKNVFVIDKILSQENQIIFMETILFHLHLLINCKEPVYHEIVRASRFSHKVASNGIKPKSYFWITQFSYIKHHQTMKLLLDYTVLFPRYNVETNKRPNEQKRKKN